ncbi:MAG: hypothetical protein IPO64_13710 [Bacteroidetes bacterium]|nr:hypothetical protein [Bacteroidota bacterium]
MPENNIVFEQLSNHHKEIDLFEIINKDSYFGGFIASNTLAQKYLKRIIWGNKSCTQ